MHELLQDEESVELTFENDENDADDIDKEIEKEIQEEINSSHSASVHEDLDNELQDEISNASPENCAGDYELVDDAGDEDVDELDAEIARELAEIDDL